MYPEQLCTPMRLELTSAGYKELKTSEEVTNLMSQEGTVLLMVNSVCGCAAGNARPAAIMATKLNPKLIILQQYLLVKTLKQLQKPESLCFLTQLHHHQ